MTLTSTISRRRATLRSLINMVRGGLIGIAELLPGISGGTVALITGVYERLIDSAAHLTSAVRVVITGPDRKRSFTAKIRGVEWSLILPLLIGMIAMVVLLAGTIESLVSTHAEASRGLFFGLVAASIVVPLTLIPKRSRSIVSRLLGLLAFAAAAVTAYLLVDLASGTITVDPPLWVVFIAAAIAVCALVVPGISGSFFLLAIGLYSPTLIAVDERDFAYLGVFAAGALLGLVTIVRVMKWLLDHVRRFTLLAMAGLMLGSLRALWPWQELAPGQTSGVGVPIAPTEPVFAPVALAVLGAALVIGLVVVERRLGGLANQSAGNTTAEASSHQVRTETVQKRPT
ncbi:MULTISPECIES: DUF368 domain-containing protein [Bacteria]